MAHSVPIDTREITITPVFKHLTVEDVLASERAHAPVLKTREVVEVRFAGSKLYSPVFPVEAMSRRDGDKIITYGERWATQYAAFLEGSEQKAAGTPLEMLKAYGISDAQLSLCRALKVYSIEALHHLEGQPLKNLGMASNDLKRMANDFMADRAKGADTADELAELRAEIERLKAAQTLPPVEATPTEIDDAVAKSDAEFAAMSDESLKAYIKDKAGAAPRGTPGRDTLLRMAQEARDAA